MPRPLTPLGSVLTLVLFVVKFATDCCISVVLWSAPVQAYWPDPGVAGVLGTRVASMDAGSPRVSTYDTS